MPQMRSTLLVIVAHPDDAEFICGATLAKYIEAGAKVLLAVMTSGDKFHVDPKVVKKSLIVKQREEESISALRVLGGCSVEFLRFEDGRLSAPRCINPLIASIRRFRPDILITHSELESHPDHRELHVAVARVCNNRGEPMPVDNPRWRGVGKPHRPRRLFFHATPDEVGGSDVIFIDVARRHVERKIAALSCYGSQIRHRRDVENRVWQSARATGRLAGCEFAEAFRPAPGFLGKAFPWFPLEN